MAHDDTVYIQHILDSIQRIEMYCGDIDKDRFLSTLLVQDGVIRQLEILGEAVRHLSRQYRDSHPSIPWTDIAGMRNKLIHDYFGVDLSMVWQTVIDDIPALKAYLIGQKEG